MRILLAHLSDIHIRTERGLNSILPRAEHLARAISAEFCNELKACFLVVTGDIAFSGAREQYDLAREFLSTIRKEMGKHPGQVPLHIILIPGNHDCDFKKENDVRKMLLDGVLTKHSADESVVNSCTDIQSEFFEFAQEAGHLDAWKTSRLATHCIFGIDEYRIAFSLYNTAWLSRFEELPGKIVMPVDALKRHQYTGETTALSVALLHHPFSWLHPDSKHASSDFVEETSDVILTGHEHESAHYTKVHTTREQNEYLEGGVLQDNTNPNRSEFSVIEVDLTTSQQRSASFGWIRDGHYSKRQESEWRPFERNKRRLRSEFEVSDAFAKTLEDPGATFTHPRKHPLTLQDLYVYPDFQQFEQKESKDASSLVRKREIISYVCKHRTVLVSGTDRSGKSALAKTLFRDLLRNGKIPLLLSGSTIGNTSTARLDQTIATAVESQYAKRLLDRFRQLTPTNGAVILDDFHKVELGNVGKSQLLAYLISKFEIVLLLTDSEETAQELAGHGDGTGPIWTFKRLEILPLGHTLRSELVNRWASIGLQNIPNDEAFRKKVIRTEALITEVFQKDLMPPLPVFVLIVLQQIETQAKHNTGTGSLGYLHEVLITDSLAHTSMVDVEIDIKYGYLGELAYALFSAKTLSMRDDEARAWHRKHCEDYRLSLEYEAMRDDLAAAGLLDYSSGVVQFKYKFNYCYFVAWYISHHLSDESVRKHVGALCARLHHEDSANIVVFLSHLSKDPLILDAIVEVADSLFSDHKPWDLAADLEVLKHLSPKAPRISLPPSDTEKNRLKLLETRDRIDRQQSGDEKKFSIEIKTSSEEELEQLNKFSQLNAASKTIQIIGQVLRNSPGSIKGELKATLTLKAYELGLRSMSFFYGLIGTHTTAFVEAFTKVVQSKHKDKTPEDSREHAKRFLFNMLESATFGFIKRISDSVGMDKLSRTYEDVILKANTISNRVIDLSVKLDHLSGFPRKDLFELADDLEKNLFSYTIVKRLVWYHFYLFNVDYKLKQAVSDKLGMNTQASFLSQRNKMK